MNTELMKQVRDHLAERTKPAFDMSSHETCIMCDVRAALGLVESVGNEYDYESLGETLGLNTKQAWELFYAGSVTWRDRELDAINKSEALCVLDNAIKDGKVEFGLWAHVLGVTPQL